MKWILLLAYISSGGEAKSTWVPAANPADCARKLVIAEQIGAHAGEVLTGGSCVYLNQYLDFHIETGTWELPR